MSRPRSLVAICFCALAAACGADSSPTAPTLAFTTIDVPLPPPVTGNYAGVWNGTTSIGTVMTFRVSAGNIVTAIATGYRDDACSGTYNVGDLTLEIARPAALASPQFYYISSLQDMPTIAAVLGRFGSESMATGTVLLDRVPGCAGQMSIIWNATKQ